MKFVTSKINDFRIFELFQLNRIHHLLYIHDASKYSESISILIFIDVIYILVHRAWCDVFFGLY